MPINLDPILEHALPFIVVLTRLGGLFLTAPMLSSSSVPLQIKAMILLALAASVYPTIDLHNQVPMELDLYILAPIVVTELMIGAAIGLFAAFPLFAVQLGGLLSGQQMGLGIAQVVNPGFDIEGDNLGQMFYLVAMMSFMLVGGLELMVGGVIETFRHVPLGGYRADSTIVELLTGLLHASFDVALRVAMPVIVIIFLENIVVGFLMKTIPGLNILNFGFPMRILLGLLVVVGALGFIASVVSADIDRVAEIIMGYVQSVGEEGAGG